IGFGAASAFAIVASMIALIGTQGMSGHESFLSVLPYIATTLILANGLASAVGLMPLGNQLGRRAWGCGVLGFVSGAALGGVLAPISLLRISSPFFDIPFGFPMWLPSIVGGLAVQLGARSRPRDLPAKSL